MRATILNLLAHARSTQAVQVRFVGHCLVVGILRIVTQMACSKSTPHPFSSELVTSVQDLIDKTTVGPMSRWLDILTILESNNVVHYADLAPEQVLCHPSNRRKLGLNAFQANLTGASILDVGCDKTQLDKAVSIELHPDAEERNRQIETNKHWVSRANGLLAPVNGGERVLSLGCGHAAAFFRATLHGCKTPVKKLQDVNGNLNAMALGSKDKRFGTCLKGWRHLVIHGDAELAWPGLPDLAQQAHNAINNVASRNTELETMRAISDYKSDDKTTWDQCVEAAAMSRPPCHDYIAVLGRFVRLYGGGPGAPIVLWLDEFAKQHAENRVLGEEFMTAVTDLQFEHGSKHYPIIRQALLALQLTSPKVINGICKLLTPSDVRQLAGPTWRSWSKVDKADIASTVDEADVAFKAADQFLQGLATSGEINKDAAQDIYGRFIVRVGLHLTGRGKRGFEGAEHKNMQAIKNLFAEEVSNAWTVGLKKNEIMSPWAAEGEAAAEASEHLNYEPICCYI